MLGKCSTTKFPHVHIPVCARAHSFTQACVLGEGFLRTQKRVWDSLEAGVSGNCEFMGAWNRAEVLCKSNQLF